MNIEIFVNNYLQNYRHEILLNPYNGLVEFAKVFQEKLMEEAVEGDIINTAYPTTIQLRTFNHGFNNGDKVSVIICKKED